MHDGSDPLRGARVLVLEDDAVIAMEMQERLADLGIIVLGPFATIEAADACVAQETPHAALLDANVGGRSSLDLALVLTARGAPVAFCTGYHDIGDMPAALASARLLTKPISDADLRAALAAMIKP